MGLDTSHDCWHGAYSAFGRWRLAVAEDAGYTIAKVTWPDKGYPVDTVMLEWHRYPQENYDGIWDETPDDPLKVLIVHSDCDGAIYPAQAIPLADRLEELLPVIAKRDEGEGWTGHIGARGGFRGVTEKFIAGLRAAAAADEPVDFH